MSDSSEVISFVAAVAGVAALFATKPSVTDINERINELIYEEVRSAKTENILDEAIKLSCASYSNECIQIIRNTMDVDIEDYFLWQSVKIIKPDKASLNCLGLLTKLYCPGFLNESDPAAWLLHSEGKKFHASSAPDLHSFTSDMYEMRYVVCIHNRLGGTAHYTYRWEGNAEWQSVSAKPGWHYWHAISTNQKLKFYIRFDKSPLDGYQQKEYYLDSYITEEKECDGAKAYEMYSKGYEFDLRPIN